MARINALQFNKSNNLLAIVLSLLFSNFINNYRD